MRRTDSLEKTLVLGKIEKRRKMGFQRMKWMGGITDPMDLSLSKLRDLVTDRVAWTGLVHRIAESDMTEVTEHAHMYLTNRGLPWWLS